MAYHLGLTYGEIKEMPYDELLGWMSYFERRPVDWRADVRAHKLMQVQGCEQDATAIFPSLSAIFTPPIPLKDGQLDGNKLKGSVMFTKMLTSIGGDKLDL